MNSPALPSSGATEAAADTTEINVFTMLLALGFPPEVAAVAARPDTFAR
jgi:hypothetical protein